ncbi:MAG: hypothetical protein U0Z44_18930 [Kouleothrix sp.]
MTGSGKTGLGIGMLEEAAIDHIPVIAIDPKGDLANLLLMFPNLDAELPALAAAGQARQRAGERRAARRRAGRALAQGPGRLGRRRRAHPPPARRRRPGDHRRQLGRHADLGAALVQGAFGWLMADVDLYRERVQACAGHPDAHGHRRRPDHQPRARADLRICSTTPWRNGQDLDIAGLIRAIQQPPFERVGVLDVESFYPGKDRAALAMQLNNLLAAPGFAAWMDGEPLDTGRLLYTESGKPRVSVVSIAHLSDRERMFFVATLLSEVVSWMRTQPGSTSLRAILYMDEIFGYLPPVANPPTKALFLTLLKQARAFGLGVVLATQKIRSTSTIRRCRT